MSVVVFIDRHQPPTASATLCSACYASSPARSMPTWVALQADASSY